MIYKVISSIALLTLFSGCNQTFDPMGGQFNPSSAQSRGGTNVLASTSVAELVLPNDPMMPETKIVVAPVEIGVMGIHPQVASGIHSQLTEALMRIPNAKVIDRRALSQISNELEISNTSLVGAGNKVSGMSLDVAGYIVRCTVNEYNKAASGAKGGSKVELGTMGNILSTFGGGSTQDVGGVLGMANPTMGSETEQITGQVTLQIQITDLLTGSLISSTTSSGTFTSLKQASSASIAGIENGNSQFAESSLQQATKAAINDAVVKIYQKLKAQPRG